MKKRGLAVHPRACGERKDDTIKGDAKIGSSPRLRGTEIFLVLKRPHKRFIPAPAGNGRARARRLRLHAVHPRACGERRLGQNEIRNGGGSSPRLRGTGRSSARAGLPVSVHPRACGERIASIRYPFVTVGSSPRLRGTATYERESISKDRFIPAPAGNGVAHRRLHASSAVHPRACGERGLRTVTGTPRRGSSPRLRGTVKHVLPVVGIFRFIPAPAGNGPGNPFDVWPRTVHPRACGERVNIRMNDPSKAGSSPRLRGTVALRLAIRVQPRFIPAPAGNGPVSL